MLLRNTIGFGLAVRWECESLGVQLDDREELTAISSLLRQKQRLISVVAVEHFTLGTLLQQLFL